VKDNYKNNNHINDLMRNNPPNDLKQCLQDPDLNKDGKQMEMSIGHLVANADFVTRPERAATFCFLNAAPQWQITNGGNFATFEGYAREIVSKAERHLDVYTGTHGNAKVCCSFYVVKIFKDMIQYFRLILVMV
jgi:hypothetical protein